MLLSLHLTIGIATSPVDMSFSMSSSQFVFHSSCNVRTYVYHTRELNGLMFARDHMNRCEKSASPSLSFYAAAASAEMAKRPSSELDFSEFTWEMVFELAGIKLDEDVAQR